MFLGSSLDFPTLPASDFSKLHLFVVEDDTFIRRTIVAALTPLGIGRITEAADGVDCLERLESEGVPDLFIMDLKMPNMDGLTTCQAIRSRPGCADIPIIFGTGVDDPAERHNCFAAGGTDLIHKPYFGPELRARLRVHLERLSMLNDLWAYQRRAAEAMAVAGLMQRALLPQNAQADLAPLKLHLESVFMPAEDVGGDLWHVERVGDDKAFVVLIDVGGHGLIAAINAFRIHGMVPRLSARRENPARWLSGLNAMMADEFNNEIFATGLCGLFDMAAETFTYASAGSPHPIIGRYRTGQKGVEILPLASEGLMLGMMADTQYPAQCVPFGRDDFLFLYSDGVLRADGGLDICETALVDAVRACAEGARSSPLTALRTALQGMTQHHDDVVMLWFENARHK